jgi:hypothetical protein
LRARSPRRPWLGGALARSCGSHVDLGPGLVFLLRLFICASLSGARFTPNIYGILQLPSLSTSPA